MVKKNKILKNKRSIIMAVVVLALVVVALIVLFNIELTGQAISCDTGSAILSVHVDGNKEGYMAPINNAKIKLRPDDRACIYETSTNENGDVNMRVNPGKYKVTIIKTGKCASHSEDIIVTSSELINFRLDKCGRNFWV